MPRAPSSTRGKKPRGGGGGGGGSGSMRHDPLGAQMQADEMTSRFGLVSAPGRRKKQKDDKNGEDDGEAQASSSNGMRITGGKAGGVGAGADGGSKYVDPKLSRNILRLARAQQEEIEEEEAEAVRPDNAAYRGKGRQQLAMPMDDDDDDDSDAGGARRRGAGDDSDDDIGELRSDEEDGDDVEEYEELEIDPEDAALMERFAAQDEAALHGDTGGGSRNLADMIMAKIAAAEQEQGQNRNAGIHEKAPRRLDGEMPMPPGINAKVVEVYSKVGELLSRYKSGPLPKAFKIIPSLPAWEDILYITGPESWTPHATLAATRIFVSNLKAQQTQKFFELVLLDKVRNEITETGKASYQTYEALKKALFKPAAFFKGILFPLCETGCTLKEAAIVSSVLTRVSIPILHSAAALLHLAEMHYAGPTSLFIRVLLDKKYALPYKVVDALVFHFLRFADPDMGVEREQGSGEKRMPVLWHQSLLVFAQRYKQDLTPDQKAALLDLLRVQRHPGISPEVRRELVSARARGEMLEEPIDEDDEDDLMSV